MLPLIALPVASTGSPATTPVKDLSFDNLLARIVSDSRNFPYTKEALQRALRELESRDLNLIQRMRARRELAQLYIKCDGKGELGFCSLDYSK